MIAKPSLLFVSLRHDTAEHYLAELRELFQDEVTLSSYVFEDASKTMPDRTATVILAAGPGSYDRCIGVFPKDKLLVFERDISFPYYLDQIFLLPARTKVLVVNELEVGAREVIQQLLSKGVDHVEFIPYWEGCGRDINGITVALSPGMFQFCPTGISEHIDIRRRHLSVATFLELLERLGLPLRNIERLMAFHSTLLFQTYKRLSDQHMEALGLQKTLQSMLSNMPDAILFSVDGVIQECNHKAEKLFRAKSEHIRGKTLEQILGNEYVKQDKSGSSYMLWVNKTNYLCTRTDIDTSESTDKQAHLHTIKAVSELENMETRARTLLYTQENKTPRYQFKDIIAASPVMVKLLATATEMAKSPLDASILITGESGTGKELFAQAIHNASHRANSPFVAINFGAIPENLVESELFGYESGAFTGASKSGKKGLFEVAHRGTIFLDEIGDAPPYIQARLLRVLEEKELMRLGSTKVVPVDVRVIAATNRVLSQMCREGAFRTDLYHRLNTFPLQIPPLRERRECLKAMIDHFQSFFVRKREFSEDVLSCIFQYSWPGNARELKNLIDFLTLKPDTDRIELEDLPHDIQSAYIQGLSQNSYDNLLTNLISYAPLKTIYVLLSLANSWKDRPMGRARMILALRERDIILSDAKCRTLVNRLATNGLLEKKKTKQGTCITAKGKAVLEYLQKSVPS